ncbi:glutathione S-transferase family protein [Polyangium aurulentum]|uniref:glutathione S-transferase family protein n=1 Tax=Polyangium aurulentum TaxID=2567896 RepID=UPI0010ADC010|nr:glutathione S-transferase family protein [Polyangium aurulentum]UQA63149.1 glutathione S-transferase family protein [Polyangium aurulentum]
MAIVFYYSPWSSAVRVEVVLEELGLAYEGKKIDLQAGEQKNPEFLEINPNGKVPALVDDGVPYFESAAINMHLGEKYGVDKGLWPAADSPLRGPAMSWLVWTAVSLGYVAGRLMYNTSQYVPAELHHAGQAEQARKELDSLLGLVEARLSEGPYMLGDRVSLLDVQMACDIWWFTTMLKLDHEPRPRMKEWLARMTERPVWKKVMAASTG